MQKYKKHYKLWYGWRKDASNFFNVTRVTIDLWYYRTDPKLMFWLEEEVEKRKSEQNKAELIKNNLENAPA